MKRYQARKIQGGRVAGVARFEAEDSRAAWRIAHEGINALSGVWVEVTEVRERDAEAQAVAEQAVQTMKHPENLRGE